MEHGTTTTQNEELNTTVEPTDEQQVIDEKQAVTETETVDQSTDEDTIEEPTSGDKDEEQQELPLDEDKVTSEDETVTETEPTEEPANDPVEEQQAGDTDEDETVNETEPTVDTEDEPTKEPADEPVEQEQAGEQDDEPTDQVDDTEVDQADQQDSIYDDDLSDDELLGDVDDTGLYFDDRPGVKQIEYFIDNINKPDEDEIKATFFKSGKESQQVQKVVDYLVNKDNFKDGIPMRFWTYYGERNLLLWNNGAYLPDRGITHKVINYLFGEYADPTWTRKVTDLIEQNYGDTTQGSNRFPALHIGWINCVNGFYNYKTDKFVSHKRFYEAHENKKINVKSVIQIPVEFNRNATCPKFDKFLSDKLPTDDDVSFVWETFGYSLSQEQRYEKFFVLKGPGNTGKSTLLNVLERLLGSDNTSGLSLTQIDDKAARFNLHQLMGKLANIHNESSVWELDGSGNLKTVVSGESVQVEEKFIPSYKGRPFSTIFAATNVDIKTKDNSGATHKRMVIIPFEVEHDKVDTSYEKDLMTKDEIEGIFLKSIEGLRRLEERDGFELTPAIKQAGQQDRIESDNVKTFFEEYIDVEQQDVDGHNNVVEQHYPASQIYDFYVKDVKDKGLGTPQSKIAFIRRTVTLSGSTKKNDARLYGLSRHHGRSINGQTVAGLAPNDSGYERAAELGVELFDHRVEDVK